MIKFVKMYLIKEIEIKIMSFGKGSFSILRRRRIKRLDTYNTGTYIYITCVDS